MTGRSRRFRSLWGGVVLALLGGVVSVPAGAVALPSVRMFAATNEVTVDRFGEEPVFLDLPIWIASVDGAFELRVSRPDYSTPVGIVQTNAATGATLRDLPDDVLDGFSGLAQFLRVKIRDRDGRGVFDQLSTFCPNGYDIQRVNDQGPQEPGYPQVCGGIPLTRGTVFGIDHGWAVNPFSFFGVVADLRAGRYTVTVSITDRYVDLFAIPAADRRVTITMRVKNVEGFEEPRPFPPSEPQQQSEGVPDVTNPDPDTLPDITTLPAFGFFPYKERGRDYLSFAVNEWNEGPQPLVVEGFREPGQNAMNAYQYFYENGEPVGRAPAGFLEYHSGGGHDHYHFLQFVEYTLLDGEKHQVRKSGKQAWCLVPTDAIDLTVPGANWRPDQIGLGTACGGRNSIWIRETIPVGWGDTYVQAVQEEAFDITGLPNGRYFVRVHVNPAGLLHETDTSNNTVLRRIRLRGTRGERRVVVPLWHGIDTEGQCCFFGEI